jgi:hypothetical protein
MTTPPRHDAILEGQLAGVLGDSPASIAPGYWVVPERVDLVAGFLVPTWPAEGWPRTRRGSAELLERFLALETATDGRIRSFAGHYGLLGLSFLGDPKQEPIPQAESVEEWRRRSRSAGFVVRQASIIRSGQPVKNSSGTILDSPGRLSESIDTWMGRADVRPHLLWSEHGPRVMLGSFSLLSEIAVRLLHAVAGGGRPLEFCPDCGAFVTDSRRRRAAGVPFRCEAHREKAASARYRSRNRELGPDRPPLRRRAAPGPGSR